jgi:hypothetical protein
LIKRSMRLKNRDVGLCFRFVLRFQCSGNLRRASNGLNQQHQPVDQDIRVKNGVKVFLRIFDEGFP